MWLHKRFGEQMHQVALGNVAVVDEAFRKEVRAFENMPLHSDAADSDHRGARITHQRATGVKLPFLFATARLAQSLDCVLRRCHGPYGEAELRNEFCHGKRTLQTKKSRDENRLVPVKRALSNIHKLIENAKVDWLELGATCDGACNDAD